MKENRPLQRGGGNAIPETIAKAVLLDNIKAEYDQLETLLSHLNEEQMTTSAVCSWHVIDQRQNRPSFCQAGLPAGAAPGSHLRYKGPRCSCQDSLVLVSIAKWLEAA